MVGNFAKTSQTSNTRSAEAERMQLEGAAGGTSAMLTNRVCSSIFGSGANRTDSDASSTSVAKNAGCTDTSVAKDAGCTGTS